MFIHYLFCQKQYIWHSISCDTIKFNKYWFYELKIAGNTYPYDMCLGKVRFRAFEEEKDLNFCKMNLTAVSLLKSVRTLKKPLQVLVAQSRKIWISFCYAAHQFWLQPLFIYFFLVFFHVLHFILAYKFYYVTFWLHAG